jgi:predicted DNA-binding ribbon-helix-helix protein
MTFGIQSTIPKHAIILCGRKTSVSLEEQFWQELRAIANAQGEPVSNLLRRIDNDRQDSNLSSAIRVFVLEHVRDRVNAPHEQRPLTA